MLLYIPHSSDKTENATEILNLTALFTSHIVQIKQKTLLKF